ncbi:hypothetical protein CCO03_14330 [Comamonas serinivorans]|uniref:Protein ImuA n=1 Tax=Comamonas serinivorans TaxID=1082851 RepID=A0A1Y0EPX5_9BURK|nr:hypothetical protein [Comamonas serinivorans]ARU05704.1 hypothetical protein CCO03_14330 [Comamonas serinivorans]
MTTAPRIAPVSPCRNRPAPDLRGLGGLVWSGDALGPSTARTVPTGFAALDAALPGAGWPTQALTEVLQPQAGVCEWRLLAPALSRVLQDPDARLYLVAPPWPPHAVGLAQLGLAAERLVWLPADAAPPAPAPGASTPGPSALGTPTPRARASGASAAGTPTSARAPRANRSSGTGRATPARLWVAEQLILANPAGAILLWLPQAQPAHLRRLQVHTQGCDAPVFVFRPEAALREASAAPLRVTLAPGPGWQVRLRVAKRRGTPCDEVLQLSAMPRPWRAVVPPRLWSLGEAAFDGSAVPAPRPANGSMAQEMGRGSEPANVSANGPVHRPLTQPGAGQAATTRRLARSGAVLRPCRTDPGGPPMTSAGAFTRCMQQPAPGATRICADESALAPGPRRPNARLLGTPGPGRAHGRVGG